MDAYILGRHEGDLPTHLLAKGEPGNRVRAMARLTGPTHNAYYAIEAPTPADVDKHTAAIVESGTAPQVTLPACATKACLGNISNVRGAPTFKPPGDNISFLFHEIKDASEAITAAVRILGEDGVGAATDGEGKILIQLVHNEQALIEKATAALQTALGNGTGVHAVDSKGVLRAT